MHDSETSAEDALSKEGQRYDPFAAPEGFRSGFVAILGEPNVGKSTMLNDMLDFKIAITSPKAQTTRDRISGIYTDEKCQIVFVDTPGIMDPHDPFNTCLRDTALEVLEEADVALHLVDATAPRALPEEAADALYSANIARVLVINKTDRLPDSKSAFALSGPDEKRAYAVDKLHLPFSPEAYDAVCYVSALKGNGLPEMIETARRYLPEGPYLYDPDQLTDRDMRFLASELVREKVLQFLEQEVPYSIATRTDDFVENPGSRGN
jgi:GTP-binding protein Era